MLRTDPRFWFTSRSGWEKTAIVVWTALLLFVSVRVFLAPGSRTVYPIFSASGRLWWTGGELYEPHRPTDVQDGYRYGPTCAILFTPFAIFPDAVGGVLWRLLNAATLLGALAWFARSLLSLPITSKQFAWLALLVIPLSVQSINNGQANIVVVACLVAAMACANEERWNLAAALMALAFVFKLYPLALGLILMLLYPRQLAWRIPAACALGMLLPVFCQDPGYVADQYEKWFTLLRSEDRSDINVKHMYRDLWLLIHNYGIPINRTMYVLMQVFSGAFVAWLCWHRQRSGWPRAALLTSTLALATAWMMLLGPATESSSFAFLAPSLAWSIVQEWDANRRGVRRMLLIATVVAFAVAVILGGINPRWGIHEAGVHAWASIGYFTYLLTETGAAAPVASVVPEPRRLAA